VPIPPLGCPFAPSAVAVGEQSLIAEVGTAVLVVLPAAFGLGRCRAFHGGDRSAGAHDSSSCGSAAPVPAYLQKLRTWQQRPEGRQVVNSAFLDGR
jgi:hypothetical protein